MRVFLKIEFLLSLWNLALFHRLFFFNTSFKISQVFSVRCGEEHALLGKVVVQVRGCVQGNPGIHVSSGCCTEAPRQMANTTDIGSSHSGGWTSEIKTPADVMSDENSLLVH